MYYQNNYFLVESNNENFMKFGLKLCGIRTIVIHFMTLIY